MEKSIESIWKEGFLENNALIAPKINDLYNQKSTHLVDKFRRMYRININAIFIFAILILPFTYVTNMPYMGIPMSIAFIVIIIFSSKFKKKLDNIDASQNSYQYLKSFNNWVQDMVAFNTKMSRYLYPFVFLSLASGFWFGSIGDDVPGEEIVSRLLIDYPDMILVFGIPLFVIIGAICMVALLAYFGGRIGMWDLNLVYGGILKKLKGLLYEMDELRA
ncbi:MAG: hypothetical protein DRI71_04345 [Bacteroidetes bacterium]|nr:MAG: hypothetical protein DRI71_04345 [Bacteroidota bacterium]